MSDYPSAIDYFVDSSRVFVNQNTHSAIVIHGTGGNPVQTAQQLGDYFRTNAAEVSVHYGIDRAGTICQYVREQDGAAGNCCLEAGYDPFWDQFNGDNLNIHTISIEHENDLTNSLTLTDVQQAASFELIAYLCEKYSIPTTSIRSHASIAPINRANCPGNYPWDALNAHLASPQSSSRKTSGLENSGVFTTNSSDFKNYWQLQGEHWHCPRTNFNIGGNMQEYYSDLSIDGQTLPLPGLPLSNEIKSGTSGITVQHFERLSLCYNPTLKAYPPGSEYSVYILKTNDPLIQLK